MQIRNTNTLIYLIGPGATQIQMGSWNGQQNISWENRCSSYLIDCKSKEEQSDFRYGCTDTNTSIGVGTDTTLKYSFW